VPALNNKLTLAQILSKYPSLKFDSSSNSIIFNNGKFNIKEYLNFPNNIGLIINKGTSIKFAKDAGFSINGPISINGSPQDPVELYSIDDKWNGITVINSLKPSSFQHTKISNLKNIDYPGYSFSGALNFYKSNVTFDNVEIKNITSEDAINIIHSDYLLSNISIKNTKSDAFDSDFSTGKIMNAIFTDIGGDAVDYSGSNAKLDNVSFTNVRDKAISVGERTMIQGNNILIKQVGVGIALKDSSRGSFDSISINQPILAHVMCYRKKNQYIGDNTIIIKNFKTDDTFEKFYSQTGSELVINNSKVSSTELDVDKLYKSEVMKK